MAKSRKRSEQDTVASSQISSQSATATAEEPQPDLRMDESHRERVARRAYELYLSRGGGHGSDWDDWLAAEREVMSATGEEGPRRSGNDE